MIPHVVLQLPIPDRCPGARAFPSFRIGILSAEQIQLTRDLSCRDGLTARRRRHVRVCNEALQLRAFLRFSHYVVDVARIGAFCKKLRLPLALHISVVNATSLYQRLQFSAPNEFPNPASKSEIAR